MQLRDALAKIEKGEAFSLEWVKCAVQTKTGGQIMAVDDLVLLVREKTPGKKQTNHVYSYQESCQYLNLWHEPTGRFYKVYKRLILKFNNEEITF